MIPVENIPKLRALWERADAAFLSDDGYIVAMAEAAGKIYAKRKAQREKEEGAPPVDIECDAAQGAVQQARDEPLGDRRAQDRREHQERRRAAIRERERQREAEREAKRDAMRALVPEWEGLSDAALRYRAKMATMTPDQREAFHRAKNAAHAAKLAEAEKIRGSKVRESKARPDEVRERRNAKRRAQRAEAKARGDVGGTA